MRETRFCTAKDCHEKHYAQGHCKRHYTQLKRHGRLTPESERGKPPRPCPAPECKKNVETKGYCRRHYVQIRRFGRLVPEREHQLGNQGCSIGGCDQPHRAKGYCVKHYNASRWEAIREKLKKLESLDLTRQQWEKPGAKETGS